MVDAPIMQAAFSYRIGRLCAAIVLSSSMAVFPFRVVVLADRRIIRYTNRRV